MNKKTVLLTISLITAFFFLILNFMTCSHAHKMIRFSGNGRQTASPEKLSFFDKLKLVFTGVNLSKPVNRGSFDFYNVNYDTIRFPGYDNLMLEGWFINNRSDKLVMLFHGYLDNKSDLLDEGLFFAKNGYDVLVLDFSGYGNSEGTMTHLGIKEAEDIKHAFDYMRGFKKYSAIVTYSISMGSAALFKAVAEHKVKPDIIIAECPFNTLLKTTQNRFRSMNYPSFPFAQMILFWGGVQIKTNPFKHNPADYAAKIECPVLLLHGKKDKRVTIPDILEIYRNIGVVEKKLVIFENAGHESYLKLNPGKWEQEIDDFLSIYLHEQ